MLYTYLYRRLGGMIASLFLLFFMLAVIYLSLRYSTPGRIHIPFQLSFQLFITHIVRYLPEITTITVFLSVILFYTRLSDDNELLAMAGLGFGPRQHALLILSWGVPATVLIALLTLVFGHHIETRFDDIKAQARQSTPQSSWIKAEHFHSFKGGTLYFKQRNGDILQNIFFYRKDRNEKTVTVARQAQVVFGQDDTVSVICQDGFHYQLTGDGPYVTIRFKRYVLSLTYPSPILSRRSKEDTDTMSPLMLLEKDAPLYRAALYERLSPIIAILLLPFLAFVLTYDTQRRRPHYKIILIGIGLLITYHGMQKVSETWLASGVMPVLYGSLWAHAFILILIGIGWYRLAHRNTYRSPTVPSQI